MLMIGRNIQLPVDLIYDPQPQKIEYPDETGSWNDYVKNMQEGIWKVSAKARQNITKNSDKQKRQYDVTAHENTYKTGDVDRELIIPETPTRTTVPTTNFHQRHNKENCTITKPSTTPPLTPILNKSIKPISPLSEISPCSISLGIEDYGSLSPVKRTSKCTVVSEKAKKTGKYTGSVLPTGYGAVRKDETCILPDGTVYKLSATWIQDPSFCSLKEKETQTEELQQQQTSTQTDDRRVVIVTTAIQTRRVVRIEKEVQTTEDSRIVVDKETEEKFN
ncbi:unnamed protein product [Mytilus coruscus]|uniref:Uncharacterized protein n=1 Tax=Mytilus coruscus TaxID=42192 RepID=A0A6J8DGS2_MYTCO|nr:unnamed protein product [Mytilus coruscus]